MNKTFSTWLDLSRLTAAVFVFLHHAEQLLKDHRLSAVASFGHDAVIFFFILSGFVIGYVSTHREHSLSEYAVARLARLYSVVVPALVLVWVLLVIGMRYFPSSYAEAVNGDWVTILLSSLLFLNESWLAGVTVMTNTPFWSIGYEAWYYILFGLYFYVSGKLRYALMLLAALIVGPKVLVLMPIWIVGMLCYHAHGKLKKRRLVGYLALGLSTGIYLWIRANNYDDALFAWSAAWFGGEANANTLLGFSKRFLPDFVIAALFILMFYGFYMVCEDFKFIFDRVDKPLKVASSYTFALYLFHYPLLVFMSQVTSSTAINLLTCVLGILLMGYFTEGKKHVLGGAIRKLIGCPKAIAA